MVTSSDKDDFASEIRNIGIWVVGGGRHCFGRMRECEYDVEEWKSVAMEVLLVGTLRSSFVQSEAVIQAIYC